MPEGVIVSYLEWLQNKQGEHWETGRVNKKLHNYLVNATSVISKRAVHDKVSLKEAAMMVAIERLLAAEK